CGEFGIRYAHSRGKRSIFLSPLKALSNQKYYDFTQKYPDITFGISTGDIKCGVTADCIIMTNEVFLNFLLNRNRAETSSVLDFQLDMDRDLGCVVFDEIHMINDPDRGSVLEKIIMLLPDHVQMIMLSGTLDAPMKFAEWVESCRATRSTSEVWVSSSQKRVVPLIHYGFVACTESFLKSVKDKTQQQQLRGSTNRLVRIQAPTAENGRNVYLEGGYKEIAATLSLMEERELVLKRKFVVNQLAQFLKEKEMLPAIFFVFSRKQVETIANEITVNLLEDDSKVPYIVRRECEQIVRKFPNHAEYMQLPEYNELVRLLEAGIGIHHAGMLQVLREIVEFMLSKKYIKILVCTSTFAAGLN
ncbi:MAG: DEAD/DEAH box helicase, partial [Planctomycetes bacterium]|nr:DEAD/DEAH box helicase [Planctomycetota bacterium]